jgi:hypothetical protein
MSSTLIAENLAKTLANTYTISFSESKLTISPAMSYGDFQKFVLFIVKELRVWQEMFLEIPKVLVGGSYFWDTEEARYIATLTSLGYSITIYPSNNEELENLNDQLS